MVDRLSLLTPRLAGSPDPRLSGLDALRELRVGMDLVVLRGARASLPEPGRTQLDELLAAVGAHYLRGRRAQGDQAQGDQARLRPPLDRVLVTFAAALPTQDPRVLAALLGLRSKFCPSCPWPAMNSKRSPSS